ncbi:UNVERIFIED_CONTAM: oprF [Trichonephila clavipes]
MKLHRLAVATMMATAAMAAHAEITVSPTITYHVFDNEFNGMNNGASDNIDLNDRQGGALALGYRVTPNVGLELRYGLTNTDTRRNSIAGSGVGVRYEAATIDTYYRFNAENKLQPYVLVGGGLARGTFKAGGAGIPHEEYTIANVALGAFYQLADNFALRAEVRGVENLQASDHDGVASVGVVYSFGGKKAEAVAPAVVAPAVVAPVVDGDDDKDGVPNSKDKCPGTPTNVVVDATGCPKVLTETVTKELRVLFDFDKAVVKPAYYAEIEGVAKLLKEYPSATVEVQGHTDSRGRAEYNQKLSERRAQAIVDTLVKQYGIDASRISAKGYGASQPVADNKTAEGRAQNRRSVAVAEGQVKVTVKK